MLSRRTSGWKLHDWLFLFIVLAILVPLLIAGVHAIAPGSGFGNALHQGGHNISLGLQWIANAFTIAANWFNQW